VYHSGLKILICVACEAALVPSHIFRHQKNQHKLKIEHLDLEAILLSFPACADTSVPTPPPLQIPIEGIKIHNGLQCTECDYACLSRKTMMLH
ncbi:hypothetical protein V8E53_014433, partial [Lactarius tabidus]